MRHPTGISDGTDLLLNVLVHARGPREAVSVSLDWAILFESFHNVQLRIITISEWCKTPQRGSMKPMRPYKAHQDRASYNWSGFDIFGRTPSYETH